MRDRNTVTRLTLHRDGWDIEGWYGARIPPQIPTRGAAGEIASTGHGPPRTQILVGYLNLIVLVPINRESKWRKQRAGVLDAKSQVPKRQAQDELGKIIAQKTGGRSWKCANHYRTFLSKIFGTANKWATTPNPILLLA